MSSVIETTRLTKAVNDLNLGSTEETSLESICREHKNRAIKASPNQWNQFPVNTMSSLSQASSEVEDSDDEKENKVSDEDEFHLSDYNDDLLSDGYDTDESPSHEAKKQQKLLKVFFDTMDKLTVEEVSEPARQWHCPACQGGPGAIGWFKGLQRLVLHARTKGSVRVNLHRMFADVLDEELRRRGVSVGVLIN